VDLRGRVAIVTGGSSGIGLDAAEALARRGARVVAVARRADRLEALVARCREHVPESGLLAGDLGDRGFLASVVPETLVRHGRLDVLVNNAAMPKHKSIQSTTPEEVEEVLRVNFLACVHLTLAALPPMLEAGEGVIVNVSSFAARVVPPRESVYAASKAALSAFTEGLWSDLAGTGVHAGLVTPGAIDTEIWEKRDEQTGYAGRLHPPRVVTEAILEVIEKGRFEVTAPRSASLVAARVLRLLAPGILRRALRRLDPIEPPSGSGQASS
jgi:short-subunit dehydrogenase